MAKLTAPIIEDLYSLGRAVYNREISLNEATEKILQKHKGNIADSSARFYIGLYSEYISGKGSTWNQNSSLVLYYVEHITGELGKEIGIKAFQAGMKFAKAKTKKQLIVDLNELWEKIAGEDAPEVLDVNEVAFEEWLRNNADKTYTDNTVKRYIRAIKKAEEWLGIVLTTHVMDTMTVEEFQMVEKQIKSTDNFEEINQSHGHGDLSAALSAYKKYLYTQNKETSEAEEGEDEVPISTKEAIHQIRDYIGARGFTYKDELIENFFLSLKSKPFVILAGTSGTGKTRLVKLFAEAIGAEYKLVSVRPDWSDGSDLFGHYDLNGKFIEGPVCECFKLAYEKPNKSVFLCLDEMNLARVEYYLSDFLSVIESREKIADGRIITTPIAQYEDGIPDNLYIIGTVNMDETTFPFSKKVLDRANTIEFSYVDLIPSFDISYVIPEKLQLPNSFLRTEYLVLSRDCIGEQEYVREICAELQKINEILVKANAHVGYRVRDEIVFYMLNNKVEGELLTYDEAFDNEIMQKILPRIQGSSASVKDMLCELFKICAADHEQKNGDTDSEKMRKILDDTSINCRYRKSAEKLELMIRRFEEDGFTSYWL